MLIDNPAHPFPPLFYPKNDYAIDKYLDITKFISLLQRRALFFCRLDKLEDQFEGTTSKANFDIRVRNYQELRDVKFFNESWTNERIIEEVKNEFENEKKFKSVCCVNCWNRKSIESAALWKIYSDFSKGIMIRSSISKLKKSMKNTEQEIYLSEIKYLDYDSEIMLDGNAFFPIIHKHVAYSYEEEVRLIYPLPYEPGLKFNWSNEEVEEGIYIKINIEELIEEIILSPYSPKWYFNLIQDILIKYGINKSISKSKLSNS